MNPPLPLPVLIPLLAGIIAGTLFLSWRGARELPPATRFALLALRAGALLGVALIALNFGHWVNPENIRQRPWIILTDTSASMAVADETGKRTRAAVAADIAGEIKKLASSSGVPVQIRPFAGTLLAALPEDAALPAAPTGGASCLVKSLSQLLLETTAAGNPPAGVIALGDFRQTESAAAGAIDMLAARARAGQTPLYAMPFGDTRTPPDLVLTAGHRLIIGFPEQTLRIPFALSSTGLAPQKVDVALRAENGKTLATKTGIEVPEGKTIVSEFQLQAPKKSARFTVETPPVPGEVRAANNAADVAVRVIESKTRIFLAEGSPYWDSKFLAQLLRRQRHADVHSVHRITDERYFRIDTGSAEPTETAQAVFPENAAELARYDLIIFGKNIDGFLTPARADALRAYVRDAGGAVLFARGKAASTDFPALEVLEPVTWSPQTVSDFRFMPTAAGETEGLFGEALPAPGASFWTSLPMLKDARRIAEIKPFARVLAEGIPAAAGERFPALVVRRYGQGVCGLVNGDGLWRWDFFPEARELGNAYEDFWIQLTQKMASFSDFLPGQDFSLRLSAAQGEPGKPVTATIAYRGNAPAPKPIISCSGAQSGETVPAEITDDAGRRIWRASFTFEKPGVYNFRVNDSRPGALPTPEATFTIPAPPAESDDLSPDVAFAEKLAAAAGGGILRRETLADFLKQKFAEQSVAAAQSAAVWEPSWNLAPVALALAALLALEWRLRRRQGLA